MKKLFYLSVFFSVGSYADPIAKIVLGHLSYYESTSDSTKELKTKFIESFYAGIGGADGLFLQYPAPVRTLMGVQKTEDFRVSYMKQPEMEKAALFKEAYGEWVDDSNNRERITKLFPHYFSLPHVNLYTIYVSDDLMAKHKSSFAKYPSLSPRSALNITVREASHGQSSNGDLILVVAPDEYNSFSHTKDRTYDMIKDNFKRVLDRTLSDFENDRTKAQEKTALDAELETKKKALDVANDEIEAKLLRFLNE